MTVRVSTAPATRYVREAGIVCHDGTSRRHQLRRLSQRQLANEPSRVLEMALGGRRVDSGHPGSRRWRRPGTVGRAAGSRPPLCRHHAGLAARSDGDRTEPGACLVRLRSYGEPARRLSMCGITEGSCEHHVVCLLVLRKQRVGRSLHESSASSMHMLEFAPVERGMATTHSI
jgi:hypothetical protein